MAARKARIKLKQDDLAINADVRVKKLNSSPVDQRPTIVSSPHKLEKVQNDDDPYIVMKTTDTDEFVFTEWYVKEDAGEKNPALETVEGESLPKGTTGRNRMVTENGDIVEDTSRVQYYQVNPDDGLEPLTKRESTVSGDEPLPLKTWLPVNEMDDFLIDKTYEMWGETDEDTEQLYELAQHIQQQQETPVFVFLMRKSWTEKWAIVDPRVDKQADEFSMVLRIVTKRIQPQHEMPILTKEDVKQVHEEVEGQTVEQDDPF